MLQGGRYAIIGIIAAAVIVATLTSLLQAPQTPAANTTGAPGQGSVLDLAAIAQHNTPRDCWTVIESTVYDITKYLNSHPGGPVISKACGNNATELFNTKGSNKPHSEFAHTLLAQFRIGTIGDIAPASPAQNIPADFAAVIGSLPKDSVQRYEFFIQNATGNYTVIFENGVVTIVPGNLPASAPPTTCIDITQAAKHSTRSDCWIAIANEFYDVTQYIPTHPGGASAITPYCGGKDATSAFNTKGGTGNTHSSFAQATLATFRVGALCTTTPTTLRATITQPLQEQVFPAGTKGVPALVTTPVAATCRYSNKDLKFSSMTGTFSSTGATAHAVSWPVSDGQTYTRYVRCEDTAGVAMTSSATVSFSVAAPLLTNATLDAATVAQHNTQSSCWLIISGYVYDVTTYISLHPGGASVLLSNCGKDATTAFNTKGGTGNTHSSTAQALLANYKLGKLVEGTPPVATITAPLANQLFGLGTVQTTLSVTTDEAATCRWSNTDQPFGTMTPFSMTGSTSHSATLSGLVAGQSYTTFVRCQDTSGNTMGSSVSVSYSISLLLDNTPPTATISAPTQGQQFTSSITTTTLSVSTNEAASCRWGTADTAYASLPNVFTSTGGVTHTTPLAGLTSGQSYTRYVRCQDLAGNAMTSSSTVSFSVAAQGSYTLAAVAQHSSQSSCWLAIHGAVYDVTSYLAIHPGGTTIILQNCGTDATTAFDTKAGSGTHSATALTLLENYRIGTLTDTTAPVVTITNPVANQAFSAGTTQATISVTTSETATCRGAVSAIPFGSMTQFSSTGATSHSTLLAALVNGGTYTYTVRCQDPASNEGSSSVTFSVATVADTSAPTATITAPTPNQAFNPGTTQATLSVTTNEAATCLWHTTNVAYASMTGTFSTTGGTSHTATIPSLANGGSYTRYVRCQDPAGNAMSTSASVSFSVMNTGTYTMAQVATHNTQGNCWIVVNANVYDVTAYIAIHPGGQAAIANECGTNATVAFNTKNGAGTHSNTAKNLLATYLLGTVSTLDNQPPVATITAPAAGQQLGSGTTSTTLSVTTDETATCRYSTTDQAYATMNAFTTTNAKTHSVTLSPLADGASYTYFVRCQDTAGNAMQSSQSISFSVSNTADTTAPTATIAAPSGQLAYTVKNTTLSVTTNEPATCRYGTSDTTYTNLPTPFTNTGTTGHSTTLTGLTAGTSYTYYVRCQDTANPPNSMQSSAVASFSLAAAPSYTMAQVATHNTLSSCWIVVQSSINNGVFDMTSFANTHPGGQQAIQINCGKNATRTFNVQDGHGTSERQILNGFWIGYVQ